MSSAPEPQEEGNRWWLQAGTMTQIAVFVVVITGSWFMLKELAVLLRPLLLAILLCYVILPMHSRIRQDRSEMMTVIIMVCGALLAVLALGLLVYGSVVSLNEELPRLTARAQDLTTGSKKWTYDNLPAWASGGLNDFLRAEAKGAQVLQTAGAVVLAYTADILVETLIVGLYVIFLLLEGRRLQKRVQGGFDNEKAQHILSTVKRINDGIANYLKAKVLSSLILAVPVTIVLFAFGVKFAALWGILTFICNFIPYVGTAVACGAPVLFGFLDLPLGWQPVAVAILLLSCHIASGCFVEPLLIGGAVGLSPLIVLISLTFWGLCWGLVGMFLAIPLTVTMRIVLANIETTKPVAALLGDE